MVCIICIALLPCGMGGVKSLIAVMGANQFHPVLHEEQVYVCVRVRIMCAYCVCVLCVRICAFVQITSFYLKFYMVVNTFAFLSTIVNAYANTVGDDMWKPFMIPAVAFGLGLTAFLAGSGRFVKRQALGSVWAEALKLGCRAMTTCKSQRKSRGGETDDAFVDDALRMLSLVPLLLIGCSFFNVTCKCLLAAGTYDTTMRPGCSHGVACIPVR